MDIKVINGYKKILENEKYFYEERERWDIMLNQEKDNRSKFITVVCTKMFEINWINFSKKGK